jgi:hypothetical protein
VWPILVAVVLAASANVRATGAEVGPSPAATRVPAWDARGLGPLPWQGIACTDMTGDGKMDLAGWGASMVGAAGVYIWLQP